MQISLEVTPGQVQAIARVLAADHAGTGYLECDGQVRDDVLSRLVGQAVFLHGLRGATVAKVISLDRLRWNRRRRAIR